MVVNDTLFSLIGICECSVAKVASYNTNLFRFCNKASVDTMKDVKRLQGDNNTMIDEERDILCIARSVERN